MDWNETQVGEECPSSVGAFGIKKKKTKILNKIILTTVRRKLILVVLRFKCKSLKNWPGRRITTNVIKDSNGKNIYTLWLYNI